MGSVGRVCVHIGPPKTGTTFIQGVLRRNRVRLAAGGWLFPRARHQHGAVHRLLSRTGADPGADQRADQGADPSTDGWDRLTREVHDSDAHTAILSVEGLARASPAEVGALVDAFAPRAVEVVYSARHLADLVPAYWQSLLRNGSAPPWAELLRSVRDPGGAESYGGRFWSMHDPRRALRSWLLHVPAELIHVLTVPPSGSPPGQLWGRFGAAIGLDPEGYDLDVPRSNVSLGGVEAEALRRVTRRVTGALGASAYTELVKHFVAREVLERREQSFRMVLPEAEHAWLRPRAVAVVDYLRDGGFPVTGDLGDLGRAAEPAARKPDDVGDGELLALLDEVLAQTVLEMARRGKGRPGQGRALL